MRKIIKRTAMVAALLFSASLMLFSFSSRKGGEGFEIYLNNKLVLQQFNKDMNTVKTIQVEQGLVNAELTVKYFHCGQVGKNRSITLKDAQNNILKEWHYTDGSKSDVSMSCKMKEVANFKLTKSSSILHLYYASAELPNGRLLANIETKGGSYTKVQ